MRQRERRSRPLPPRRQGSACSIQSGQCRQPVRHRQRSPPRPTVGPSDLSPRRYRCVLPLVAPLPNPPPLRGVAPRSRSTALSAAALEELLHLREEPFALRAALAMALGLCLELLEQLALAPCQMLRRLHRDLYIHVAAHRTAQHREAFAAQSELVAGLRARRDLHLRLAAVDRRHFDIATERRLRHPQWDPHEDVLTIALKDRMRSDRNMHVEIAGRGAVPGGLPLTSQPDARAVFHTGRDRHLKRAFALHCAGAPRDLAWTANHAPLAATGRTGAFDQEEPLLRANLAGTTAGGTGIRCMVLVLGSRTGAGITHHAGRHPQIRLGTGKRVGQLDLDGLANI